MLLFYYALVYVVLPLAAFGASDRDLGRLVRTIFRERETIDAASQMAGFFYPIFTPDASISVFPALLQVGIAAGVLYWLLDKRRKAAAAPQLTEKAG
jgi:hypothetical protein